MPSTKAVTRAEFDALIKKVEAINEITKKNKGYLFGNGDKGVDETLRNIENFLNTRKEWEKWAVRTAVAFVMVTFLTMSINGMILFFRVLPALEKLAAIGSP